MKRGARWFGGLVFTLVAGAASANVSAGGTESAPPTSAGRYACVGTASDAELRVDLGNGDRGVWASEITVTVTDGNAAISGTVYDVDKLTGEDRKSPRKSPRKPPQLHLKPKTLAADQVKQLLQGLSEALGRSEQEPSCPIAAVQTAKVSWSCKGANGNTSTSSGGDMSFEGDRCPTKEQGYTHATGIAQWAAAAFKRLGAR